MAKAPPLLTDADYARLAAFRYALRRFTAFSAEAAHAAGLTARQHQALLAIRGHGDGHLTIGALAERLLIAPHTAAELVSRLVAADLVGKIADPDDRRRVGLALTSRAEAALRTLSLAHLHEVRDLAPPLMALFRALDGGFDG